MKSAYDESSTNPLMNLLMDDIPDRYQRIETYLLVHPEQINQTNSNDRTPLFYACVTPKYNQREDIVYLLLKHGANPNAVDNSGMTILMHVVQKTSSWDACSLSVIKLLLENGVDVNARDKIGATALLYAAWADSDVKFEMVQLLIDYGANALDVDHLGRTGIMICSPLHENVMSQHQTCPATIRLLLEKGLDPNAIHKGNNNITALIYLCMHTSPNIEAIQILLDSGANVNYADKCGQTALMMSTDHSDVFKLLIQYDADINTIGMDHWTVLHYACDARNSASVENVRLLLELGADVNARDLLGRTPLMVGAHDSNKIKLLLNYGADPNLLTPRKKTTLMFACEMSKDDKNLEGIKLLVGLCDVNQTDNTGKIALHHALSMDKDNPQTIKLLLESGSDPNLLSSLKLTPLTYYLMDSYAGCMPNITIVNLLQKYGADINVPDYYGETPLFVAVETETISKLLGRIELTGNDSTENIVPNVSIIDILIDCGANVNFVNIKGMTPLMHLAKLLTGRNIPILNVPQVAKKLISRGANVNIQDNDGNTALMCFISLNAKDEINFQNVRLEICRQLLQAGTDINLYNNSGKRAIDLALENPKYNDKIITLLNASES